MPRMLVVDDDPAVRHTFQAIFKETAFEVILAADGAACLQAMREDRPDLVMLDVELPDQSGLAISERIHAMDAKMPIIFITAASSSDTAIEAMKLGAYDYLVKPLDFREVLIRAERAYEIRRLNSPVAIAESFLEVHSGELLVGRCASMQKVYKAIGRVAGQDVTVLIQGETGTGKELVARAIYQHGRRSNGPFLAVNCAAIPEALLESELFGHEKGAFTGADKQRIGKFEQCHGGTLFLDEIGDMTPLTQSKVLRVLQEQQFERVGGTNTIRTDVRIIAATHRNLEAMVEAGDFRADLYYRLAGFGIHLPPLRDREEDIHILTEHFVQITNRELHKRVAVIPDETWAILESYPWPGNVRELQSVVKQALLQATGSVLMPDFLPEHVREGSDPEHAGATPPDSAPGHPLASTSSWEQMINRRLHEGATDLYAETLDLMERTLITKVLQFSEGNQTQASKILGITRGSLRHKIRTLNIKINSVIDGENNAASGGEGEAAEGADSEAEPVG